MIIKKIGLMMLLTGSAGMAQQPPAPPQPQSPAVQQAPAKPPLPNSEELRKIQDQDRYRAQAATLTQLVKPPLERALGVPGGKWWTRPEMAQRLGLTAEQTKKMDDTFQQFRLKLIDLNASVQKEELIMEPLVSAEQPEESKIVGQIDKVAMARAELEKANAKMLLGIRRLLTPEQWNKLKAEPAARQPQMILTPQPGRR